MSSLGEFLFNDRDFTGEITRGRGVRWDLTEEQGREARRLTSITLRFEMAPVVMTLRRNSFSPSVDRSSASVREWTFFNTWCDKPLQESSVLSFTFIEIRAATDDYFLNR